MLVKDAVLQFVREIDPNSKASAGVSVPITAANLDSTDGEKFTAQKRLDLYNQARRIVLQELLKIYGKESDHVIGFYNSNADISWTNYSTYSIALQPNGYIAVVDEESSLRGASNVPIRIRQNPGKLLAGNNPELTQSATTIFAFERESDFVHYANPGESSLIATATYKIDYIGCVDHTLTTVASASTTVESFLESDMPFVITGAIILARNEQDVAGVIAHIRNAVKS